MSIIETPITSLLAPAPYTLTARRRHRRAVLLVPHSGTLTLRGSHPTAAAAVVSSSEVGAETQTRGTAGGTRHAAFGGEARDSVGPHHVRRHRLEHDHCRSGRGHA